MSFEVGIKVVNGEILFENNNIDQKFTIKARNHINLFINDKLCKSFEENVITKNDKIEYTLEKQESSREVHVFIPEDKMSAYIRVEYTPEIEYKLREKQPFINLALSVDEVSRKDPEYYTVEELKSILKEKKIIFGIKEDALKRQA